MKITNMAGQKVSFKKYCNDNCLKMADDLKNIKMQSLDFDMKEAFKLLAKHAYINDIIEPRAKLVIGDMIQMSDDRGILAKMIHVMKLK